MSVNRHYSLARLRSSILHFLGGKAISAGLTFIAFVLVARLLSTEDYAVYVAALAAVELGLALATFGLDWVAARYIPDFRIHAPWVVLKRFVLRLAAIQFAIYLAFAILMAICAEPLSALFAAPAASDVLTIYAIYLFTEGGSRMLRDQMLGHLLLQGRAQIALLLRNTIWVGGLAWLYTNGEATTVRDIAVIEVLAATGGIFAACAGLYFALLSGNDSTKQSESAWTKPTLKELFILARSSYLSYLFSLAYGPYVITLLLSRLAGAEATAAFGFARNLADQIRRFLPAELLLGLVRPALIARYSASSDFGAFNRSTSIIFLISFLALSPVLVLGIAYGDIVISYLSHGKFPESALYLALFLLSLVPFSHRRMIEMIANTISHSAACARANAYLIGLPLIMVALLLAHAPIWTVLTVSLLAEIVFSWLVIREIQRCGFRYRFPLKASARVFLAIFGAVASLSFFPSLSNDIVGLLTCSLLALTVTALFLYVCKPLNSEAKELILRFLGRTKAV